MEIQLKEGTLRRVTKLFDQMQQIQNQIGSQVDNIILTICEENNIDLEKFAPKFTEGFKSLVFEEIAKEEQFKSKAMHIVRDEVEEGETY